MNKHRMSNYNQISMLEEQYYSIEGKLLPPEVKNKYWYWNKEHAFDELKKNNNCK